MFHPANEEVVAHLLILREGMNFLPSRDQEFVRSLVSQGTQKPLSEKQKYWVRKKAESRHIPYAVVAHAAHLTER